MTASDWRHIGWSDWLPLASLTRDLVPSMPGVYRIGLGQALPRAFGTDPEGVLDIGKASNLLGRLQAFKACAETRGKTGHMAGWRYAHFDLQRVFPPKMLKVCWCVAVSEASAAEMEAVCLDRYIRRHLEQPPLNYAASWRLPQDYMAQDDLGGLDDRSA